VNRFEAMSAFVAVGESGSFTRAARRLGKPVSTVSRTIAALESALGAQLLVRNTRKAALTDQGREYLGHCRRILADVEEAEAALGRDAHSLSGVVRLTAPTVFGRMFAAPLTTRFVREHPGVQAELTLTDRLVDLIGEGHDLALRTAALEDSELIARRVGGFRRIMCCAPAYLQAAGPIDTLEDLTRHSCLVFTRLRPRAEWPLADVGGQVRTVQVSGCLAADNTDALHQAALDGAGVILTPTWQARADLLGGRLVPVLPQYRTPEIPVSVLFPRTRLLSVRVRRMVEAIAAALPDFLGPDEPAWAPAAPARAA
jgi:DNA-binding transcriptional LysR family regulator